MAARPAKRARARFTNRFKCFVCYLLCFALPLLWQAAGLWLAYPYKLAGASPAIAQNVADAAPALEGALAGYAALANDAAAQTPQAARAALAARDLQWRAALGAWFALAWLMTLVVQLAWRFTHASAILAARAARRAVRHYRLCLLAILAGNGLFAAAVWLLGARFVAGRTAWDYLVYFGAYALNVLAAFACFRLAAPPVLSGRGAFFRRL